MDSSAQVAVGSAPPSAHPRCCVRGPGIAFFWLVAGQSCSKTGHSSGNKEPQWYIYKNVVKLFSGNVKNL